ncbi:MAG TPA: FG-GAP and VCBS repeat-containing protein, partial [Gemmatimonadaceae bacterium]
MTKRSLAITALALTACGHRPHMVPNAAPVTRFATHEVASGLTGGYQVIAADLNGDGKPDLIAVSDLPELVWFENPSWTRHVLARGLVDVINVAAADIDGDGIAEIAVASGFSTRPDSSSGIVAILTHGADPTQPWTMREIDRVPATHRL